VSPTGPQLEGHLLRGDLGAVAGAPGPPPPAQGRVQEHLSPGHVDLQVPGEASLLQQGFRSVAPLAHREPVGEILERKHHRVGSIRVGPVLTATLRK